jgi:AcrR family transcriptional regulator
MAREKDPRLIEAATAVFLRYGFRRTTMGDIAKEAGVSRPALYLRFCNKEQIFAEVMKAFLARTLEEIRQGLPALTTPQARLRFAFECWAVRPFTLMQSSPDARDLASCELAFMETLKADGCAAFEALLTPILADLPALAGSPLPAVAHVLTASVHGFKQEAKDAAELGGMIDTLLKLTTGA